MVNVKSLILKEKLKIKRIFDRNENKNYHSDNAVMLIKRFGTEKELKKALEFKELHKKQGSLTWEQSDWFYKHGTKKYYKKLL